VVDGDAGWVRDRPDLTVVELDGPRVIFDVTGGGTGGGGTGDRSQAVLAEALQRGPVRSFGPVLPSLAEIFREVV
jgi:ABC-2 type transport system ATP-binding protein